MNLYFATVGTESSIFLVRARNARSAAKRITVSARKNKFIEHDDWINEFEVKRLDREDGVGILELRCNVVNA